MGTGQLLAGNLVNLLVSILAFLQIIPWPIAGYLIIGVVLLVTLSHLSSSGRAGNATDREVAVPRTSIRVVPLGETASQKNTGDQTARGSPPILTGSKSSKTEAPKVTAEPIEKKPDDCTQIAEGDYLSFEVNLKRGEQVEAEVSSDGDVNAYVLNEENLTALESDQEFWYEAGSEGVRNAALHFTAPEDGEWYFIIENAETKEVGARVKINKAPPFHQLPSLKTEGLELPDARLEGKLQ